VFSGILICHTFDVKIEDQASEKKRKEKKIDRQ